MKEYMDTWNEKFSKIQDSNRNINRDTKTRVQPFISKPNRNFKDYLKLETKLKNAFKKMRPEESSELSDLTGAEDGEEELTNWKKQFNESTTIDIFNVRDLSQERQTKSARRVNLEKDHTRPLKMASNYKSIMEMYRQTSSTFGTFWILDYYFMLLYYIIFGCGMIWWIGYGRRGIIWRILYYC